MFWGTSPERTSASVPACMRGIPISPAERTSFESPPTTWASWSLKSPLVIDTKTDESPSNPPISSGTWSFISEAIASPKACATGSAISCQTGSVARAHSWRVISRGRPSGSAMSVDSLSHSAAVPSNWANASARAGSTDTAPWAATLTAWSRADVSEFCMA